MLKYNMSLLFAPPPTTTDEGMISFIRDIQGETPSWDNIKHSPGGGQQNSLMSWTFAFPARSSELPNHRSSSSSTTCRTGHQSGVDPFECP